MALATIASVVGIGAGLNSLFNSGGGGSYTNSPYQYIPGGSLNADISWNQLLNQENQQIGGLSSIAPYLQQIFQQQQGLPYYQQQNAANLASQYYPGIANADISAGSALGQAGGQALGAGSQVLNTAFDPQNALYSRMQQQVQDQANAQNSMSGIATTPYGAGVANQAMSNFNIDWQNQQLQRQTQGIGAYGQANQLAGADLSSMLQMFGQAPQNITQGGALPVQTGQQIGQMQTGAANQYAGGIGNSMAPYGAMQSQIIPYLYAGQGAGGNAFNMFAQQQGNQQQQQMYGANALFQGLNAFGGTSAGQGTNNWLGSLFGGGGTAPYSGSPDQYGYSGSTGLSTQY